MTKESYIKKEPDCEYFCRNCLQLRLSFLIKTHKCSNCQSTNIIRGKPGSLDKKQLKKQYQFLNLLGRTDPFRKRISKHRLLINKENMDIS